MKSFETYKRLKNCCDLHRLTAVKENYELNKPGIIRKNLKEEGWCFILISA